MLTRIAYIIMPVGSDPNFSTKRSVMESSLAKWGWSGRFPLDFTTEDHSLPSEKRFGFALSATIEDMKFASLVVADLSLERPSCYYELAIAQSIRRPTFLVATNGTPIHQLADRGDVHFYADTQELSDLLDIAFSLPGNE